MTAAYERLARPLLFRSAGGDPELVHERMLRLIARVGASAPALRALRAIWARGQQPVTLAGIDFPSRVGLAAGMDKDGVGVRAWSSLGFGHAELGTVTAEPQLGNERPRLFRVPASSAIINRMGFNNAGAAALARRLDDAGVRRGNRAVKIPLGISLGKTKSTPLAAATADYLTSFRLLAPYADYVAVNVSSPNTPGLRALQDAAALRDLTAVLVAEARALDPKNPVPVFVKIAPDLGWPALDELLEVVVSTGVTGLVATNTTLARDLLDAELEHAAEPGGLSGAPLTVRARKVVRYLSEHAELPVIGCGGILTAADGQAMLDAGARLLQIYTGFIYRGPALVAELNRLPASHLEGEPAR